MTSAPRRQTDLHLVLIGLPGAGKSSLGRAVARQLNRPFMDFDTEIERRSHATVSHIFAERGEAAFREMEVELTHELVAAPPMVLAPGGGWVTNPGVLALLRPRSTIIHLRVSPSEAVRRVSRSRRVRPLLRTTDPLMTMQQLWESRAHLYALADVEIATEVHDSQRVIDSIVALAIDLTPELG